MKRIHSLMVCRSFLFLLWGYSLALTATFSDEMPQGMQTWIVGAIGLSEMTFPESFRTIPGNLSGEETERALRQLAISAAGSKRLNLVLFGSIEYDRVSGDLVWSSMAGVSDGIPFSRMLRYALHVDPMVRVKCCLKTDKEHFEEVRKNWALNNNEKHEAFIFSNFSSGEEKRMRERILRSQIGDATATLMQEDIAKDIGLWSLIVNGVAIKDSSLMESVEESNFAQNGNPPAKEDQSSTDQLLPLFDLNFGKNGSVVSTLGEISGTTRFLSDDFTTTSFAVRQYAADISPRMSKEVINIDDFRIQAESVEDLKWVFWVYASNIEVDKDPLEILRLPKRTSVFISKPIVDACQLVVKSKINDLSQPLAEGVWNLFEIHLSVNSESAENGISLRRVYPKTIPEKEEWKPVYDPLKYESEAVLNRLHQPQLILDSVRAFGNADRAQIDALEEERFQRFGISEIVYSDVLDLNKGIRRETDGKAVLADWDNIVACFKGEGERFIQYMDLQPNAGYLVQRAGERHFGKDRHYFFENHDHRPGKNYLFHDQFENYLVGVGSWNRLFLRAFFEWIE